MTDRGATSAFLTESAKSANQPIKLVGVELDSESVYMTNAYKEVIWDGNVYLPLGHLLGISDIEETSQLMVSSLTISLSGVDQSLISIFLQHDYIDRVIHIYKAYLSTVDDSLVSDPVLFFDGRLDQPVINEDIEAGTSIVSASATNAWVDFERRPGRHTNHLEQQVHFSGDMGFEFASEIVKDIVWGPR